MSKLTTFSKTNCKYYKLRSISKRSPILTTYTRKNDKKKLKVYKQPSSTLVMKHKKMVNRKKDYPGPCLPVMIAINMATKTKDVKILKTKWARQSCIGNIIIAIVVVLVLIIIITIVLFTLYIIPIICF